MKTICTVHRERTAKARAEPRVTVTSILKAVTGAAAIQAFSLSLGLDLKMRRIGLNQVEREWIVIRCVKTFVYLPAVYLNRAAHERPVDLSPWFKDATRWCGGAWRRSQGVPKHRASTGLWDTQFQSAATSDASASTALQGLAKSHQTVGSS
jgi:hypothetical protein